MWRVSAFVSVRSYQHSGGMVVIVTRMPNTACLGRNSTSFNCLTKAVGRIETKKGIRASLNKERIVAKARSEDVEEL